MNIAQLVNSIYDESVKHRRYLHQHPELSCHEVQTAQYVVNELQPLNIPTQTNVGGHGVVALIEGQFTGPTLMIRADMDALPIKEATNLPYQSLNQNVMHACGHDIHTANLIVLAKLLVSVKDKMHGNVKLVFQPAEEGHGGAKKMIADGIMQNPTVDYAIGMHVDPHLQLGTAAVEDGPITAFPEFFEVTLTGRGGHGSVPFAANDPIKAGIHFYQMVNELHKEINPLNPNVIQIGAIQAGEAPAVIPDQCILRGTVRTHFQADRQHIQARIREILALIGQLYHVETTISYIGDELPVVNDPQQTAMARTVLADVFDKGLVQSIHFKMVGEDFASYSHLVPATFLVVGCSDDLTHYYPLHNAKFNPNEAVLKYGCMALFKLALNYLNVHLDA